MDLPHSQVSRAEDFADRLRQSLKSVETEKTVARPRSIETIKAAIDTETSICEGLRAAIAGLEAKKEQLDLSEGRLRKLEEELGRALELQDARESKRREAEARVNASAKQLREAEAELARLMEEDSAPGKEPVRQKIVPELTVDEEKEAILPNIPEEKEESLEDLIRSYTKRMPPAPRPDSLSLTPDAMKRAKDTFVPLEREEDEEMPAKREEDVVAPPARPTEPPRPAPFEIPKPETPKEDREDDEIQAASISSPRILKVRSESETPETQQEARNKPVSALETKDMQAPEGPARSGQKLFEEYDNYLGLFNKELSSEGALKNWKISKIHEYGAKENFRKNPQNPVYNLSEYFHWRFKDADAATTTAIGGMTLEEAVKKYASRKKSSTPESLAIH